MLSVSGYRDYEWREEKLDEALAGALRSCWRHFSQEISDGAELRLNFLQLLNTLCNLDPAHSGLAGTRRRPCLSSRRVIFWGPSLTSLLVR